VNQAGRDDFDLLKETGLYDALVERGLLVAHERVDTSLAAGPDPYAVIAPERISFISYPYEWSFSQLQDVALATLEIQSMALDHGMTLRDASAYNIQFRDGRPVLIDTLSLGRLPEDRPWVAYRQFCQHFLAPLALMSYRDVRLGQLLRVHLDGVPLDLAAELLPSRARSRPPLLMHVFAHAKSQAKHAADADGGGGGGKRRGFSQQAFRGVLSSLESGVRKLSWDPGRTEWSGYYAEADHYTAEAAGHKRELIEEFLGIAGPSSVWDLGGNTGVFSRIASERGIPTVCFDVDPGCVEVNHREIVAKGQKHLLPLVMDLTNPSPAIGWDNRERASLAERGPADMAFALALIHHLAIGNNVPLPQVAATLRGLCTWLAIEWVPKSDPKVGVLLASREDVFPGYTQEDFERAFEAEFTVERTEPIKGSERTLYLLKGR
jgi:ribosomal protein L11 methylase PrmA